jgi:uncharacterized membrane protein
MGPRAPGARAKVPGWLIGSCADVHAWPVLLVIPGLYLLGRLALFGFRLVDGQPGLIASFRQSAVLTSGGVQPLIGLTVLLFLLNVLGACLLGVGLFVTIPPSALVMAHVYRQLMTIRLTFASR